MFVLKAFALFQIPPLGASPGSSLGHTGQAEDTCGHAALSSHAEVRGRESQPGEGGTACSVGGTLSQGGSGHGETGKACLLFSPGGAGWPLNDSAHLKQKEMVFQVQVYFLEVEGAMPRGWGSVRGVPRRQLDHDSCGREQPQEGRGTGMWSLGPQHGGKGGAGICLQAIQAEKCCAVGSSWLPRAGVPRWPRHAAVACQPGIPGCSLSAPIKCLFLCVGADIFSFLGGLPPKFPACSH